MIKIRIITRKVKKETKDLILFLLFVSAVFVVLSVILTHVDAKTLVVYKTAREGKVVRIQDAKGKDLDIKTSLEGRGYEVVWVSPDYEYITVPIPNR